MTGASDDRHGRGHRGVDTLLDVVVFAPAGLVIAAVEEVPRLAARGRDVVGSRLTNAHAVGRMAVAFGRKEVQRRMGGGGRPASPPPAAPPEPAAPTGATDGAPGSRTPAVTPAAPAPAAPPAGTLAIPDYDALSASQVVHRLEGLSNGELEAVRTYEGATRGRRTILGRIEQLLA